MKKTKKDAAKYKEEEKGEIIISASLILFLFIILSVANMLSIIKINYIILNLCIILTSGFLLYTFTKSDITNIQTKKSKLTYYLLAFGVAILIATRIIPLFIVNIPLGYDAGIYDYAYKGYYSGNLINQWVSQNYEPGLFMLGSFFHDFGLSFEIIQPVLYIFIEVTLLFLIFFTVKKFFDEETSLIATLLVAFSLIQFKAYTMAYGKTIFGLLMLFSAVYFWKSNKKLLFIASASILAVSHKPTFMIFSIAFLINWLINLVKTKYLKDNYERIKSDFLSGLILIVLFIIFYFQRIASMYKDYFAPVLSGKEISGGLFMDFFAYKSIFYVNLPLLAVGIYFLFKNWRDNNQRSFFLSWLLANLLIVVFKIIFFNRFILHLDIVLLIATAFGFTIILNSVKKIRIARYLVIISIAIILCASAYSVFDSAIKVRGLIGEEELNVIKSASYNTEPNANLMVVSSIYATWGLYSERNLISPGLFNDKMTKAEWIDFWNTNNQSEAIKYLDLYDKPLYIYVGRQAKINREKFGDCFQKINQTNDGKGVLLKYIC